MTPVQEMQASLAASERLSAINYDINRVATWQRRQGMCYARRQPGTIAVLLLALFGWFKGDK